MASSTASFKSSDKKSDQVIVSHPTPRYSDVEFESEDEAVSDKTYDMAYNYKGPSHHCDPTVENSITGIDPNQDVEERYLQVDPANDTNDDDDVQITNPIFESRRSLLENSSRQNSNNANDPKDKVEEPKKNQSLGRRIKSKMYQHILPISLIIGVILGIAWPTPGVYFGTKVKESGISPTHHIAIMTIFFISGIKLTTDVIKDALGARLGIIWGLLSILVVTVSIAVPLTQVPVFPDVSAFQKGLVVFFAMPTTISSGIVLTEQANGNVALAVLLTVVSNFTASFTVGPMLKLLADFGDIDIEVVPIIIKMCYLVLAPLVFGKLCRYFKIVQYIVKNYKMTLKLVSTYCLVSLPWVTTSRAMEKGGLDSITAAALFTALGWAVMMHLFFLLMNFGVGKLLRLGDAELRAVVIQGSQKTLPMSIVVITALDPGDPDESLMQIACILAHLSQIVIDSFGIGFWKGSKPNEPLPENGELYKVLVDDTAGFISEHDFTRRARSNSNDLFREEDEDEDEDEDGDLHCSPTRTSSYHESVAYSQ